MPEQSVKLCECGCGKPTKLAQETVAKRGYVKGRPHRYVTGHHAARTGPDWLPEDRGYLTPCHIWQGGTKGPPSHRYGKGFKRGRGYGDFLAHRQAWIDANGPIPDGLWVLHKCDVTMCVNAEHLFVGMPRDNVADMHAKGRANTARGERTGTAKLTAEQVRLIRADATSSHAELARRHGVSPTAIVQVRKRRSWTHVE